VKGNDLSTKHIVPFYEVGDNNRMSTSVGSESFNPPLSVISILGKLDPAIAGRALVGRCNIHHDRTFVGWVNDLVSWTTCFVVPFKLELWDYLSLVVLVLLREPTNLVTSLDRQRLSRGDVDLVASHVLRRDIHKRGVAWWRANIARSTVTQALINPIDPSILDGGMGGDKLRRSCESENTKNFHFAK
jgi:hypothetical protein